VTTVYSDYSSIILRSTLTEQCRPSVDSLSPKSKYRIRPSIVRSGFNTDYGSSEPLKTLVMLCYNFRATYSHWRRLVKYWVGKPKYWGSKRW